MKKILIFSGSILLAGLLFVFVQIPFDFKNVSVVNTYDTIWSVFGLRDRDDIKYLIKTDSTPVFYLVISDTKSSFNLKSIKVLKVDSEKTEELPFLISPFEYGKGGIIYIPLKGIGILKLSYGDRIKPTLNGKEVLLCNVKKES